ncbi:MAG: carboxypeptidase regulatory-like domain-containing protein [Lacipirellulaceae bacterium]
MRTRLQTRLRTTSLLRVAALGPSLLGIGCGGDDGRPRVYPTSGTVTVGGQPAAGAELVFYPSSTVVARLADGTEVPLAPQARTTAEGRFEVRTFAEGDGAPAGEYRVSVVWPDRTPRPDGSEPLDPPDRLKGKYGNPAKSGLKASVPEGGGELAPLNLR